MYKGDVMDRITTEHTLQMALNRFNKEMDTHYSTVNVKHEHSISAASIFQTGLMAITAVRIILVIP